jgi:heptosyltransferase-1
MHPANFPSMESEQRTRAIRRLLIVRLSAMGDVLHALPAVAALRLAMPQIRFGWLVEQRWADLVRSASLQDASSSRPIVDKVHAVDLKQWRRSLASLATWHEIRATIGDLRAADYEVAIDFQGAARSALLARLSRAPSIYGFAEPRENVASMFYTTAIVTKEKHVIAQNLALASALAQQTLQPPPIKFSCTPAAVRSSPAYSPGYVLLNPGAGWGAKQWPPQRYGEVAKRLAAEFQLRSLINCGPGEDALTRAAQAASHGAAEPISCSPVELIDVVRSARLFIGGDTGPMHLAAAMGIPVVAIFGPTDPARTGPFGTRSMVLRNPDSRSTLSHETSPDVAMLQITVDVVVRAAIQLLREEP